MNYWYMKNFLSQILQQLPAPYYRTELLEALRAMESFTLPVVLPLTEVYLELDPSFKCDMNQRFLCMHFSHALDPQKSQNRLSFFCISFSQTMQLFEKALSSVGSVSLNIAS